MSLWGRTVITSLASAIPVVGTSIVHWLWGGFSVTLSRQGQHVGFFLPQCSYGLTFFSPELCSDAC